ncbi:extracellular solute-binding protein [Treponema sp. OttesenSCG-928-L16]|nr:extracellular solute-binding protein [Treponema sp. OttesenSCG-928-L16]
MAVSKKVLIGLLAMLVAAGALFAAGGSDAAKGDETIILNLWHHNTYDTRRIPIENAAKRFEQQNPGVKIIISVYENDPYKTKLKTVSGDDFPDVFHSWGGGWLKSFVDAGLVADITEESKAWADQISPAALEFNRFDGKVYGSPYINSSTILYYNKEIFSRFNLQPPRTLAELDAVAATLKANNIIPFALANLTKWPGAQHFVFLSMRIGGADIFQRAIDGKVKFTDETFIKAGQILQEQVAKGYFPAGANGMNWDTGASRMMFYTGQAAMIVQTSGFMATCKSENADFYKDKLGIALYPAVEGGKGKMTDLLSGENAFSVGANTKHKAMAAKLVGFLSADTQFQQDFLNGGSLVAKVGLTTTDPVLQAAMKQLEEATYLQNFIDQTLSPELAEVHKDTTQALYGNVMPPLQAAQEMQKAFDASK